MEETETINPDSNGKDHKAGPELIGRGDENLPNSSSNKEPADVTGKYDDDQSDLISKNDENPKDSMGKGDESPQTSLEKGHDNSSDDFDPDPIDKDENKPPVARKNGIELRTLAALATATVEAMSTITSPTEWDTKSIASIIQLEPKALETSERRRSRTIKTASGTLVDKKVPSSKKKKAVVAESKEREPPPPAVPSIKLEEFFLQWFGEDTTEEILRADVMAVKAGRGQEILKEVSAAVQNVVLPHISVDDEKKHAAGDAGEGSKVLKRLRNRKPTGVPAILLLPTLEISSLDTGGDGDCSALSPLSPKLLNSNPLSPTIGNSSPQPVQHISPSIRSPIRCQAGLPPLSPDFLTSKHGRNSSSSLDISRKINECVPRFYWPEGKPPPTPYIHETISKAEAEFTKFTTPTSVNYEEFGKLLQNIGVSLYWKKPFWTALGLLPSASLGLDAFKKFYKCLISSCPDEASRFLRILWTARAVLKESTWSSSSGNALEIFPMDFKRIELIMSDFVPMIQDIVDTHPGLGFLREAPEFHSRYVTTVISRIFYKVNRSWTGRLTLSEIRRSNLLRVIKRLEEETDVNAITDYFSYEHFYVIYCKFWELDKDHDLLIDKVDLGKHNEQALSSLIVDRIFSGTVLRGWDISSTAKCPPGKMTYSDFVWFIISEEDKKDPTAIEYWFRCLDLDGDGILSPFELQFFYSEQEHRIESLGIEPLDFSNVFCQMVDMLRCSPKGVRLKDLKRNPQLACNFFNTLFNLDKYLDHEQRDPFASSGSSIPGMDLVDTGETEWDRFAASEYELLIAEESPTDHNLHDSSDFEDLPS